MSLQISRVLHAGYVFECAGKKIIFDPIFENPFSGNCHAFPDVKFDPEQIRKLDFAAVFISHFHDDHCSLESLNLLDRDIPIYIYCLFNEIIFLIKSLGFKKVTALQIDTPVLLGPFEIIPRRALDVDVDSIFHIKAAGLNVLNVVDSWIDYDTLDQLAEAAKWDLILWPFQTMRELEVIAPSRATPASGELPPEWIEQLKILKPQYIVPSSCQFVQESWSWYNHALFPITYRQFEKEVKEALPLVEVLRLNPSESIMLSANSWSEARPLSWVQPRGEQNVDYAYLPLLTPPSTAEVARRFPPLTDEQTIQVLNYCQHGLLEKYKSLESFEEGYFAQEKTWRLSVYDHHGSPTHFYYHLHDQNITLRTSPPAVISWTTEVPLVKIYSALELGESLTSMYMRINDMFFEASVEKELKDIDIGEDPLIRCLFNGEVAAYQSAQLKRLQRS